MTEEIKHKFETFFAKNFKDEPDSKLEFDADYPNKAFVKDKDGFLRILEFDNEFGEIYIKK